MSAPEQTQDLRSLRVTGVLAAWTIAWVASIALAKFGPERIAEGNDAVAWAAIGLCVVLGIGWIFAHAHFLRTIDELQRKIMLDAIAVALGAGLVGGFAYAVASDAGLYEVDSAIAFLTVLMSVIYMIGVAIGNVRYR